MRQKVMVYCLDQDHASTASMGIYNYTRKLLVHMARVDDPGFDLVILLSETNADDLKPSTLPGWMDTLVRAGRYANGPRRLLADHWLAPLLARRAGAGLIHFPKGWRSAAVPRRIKTIVTMHDTIPDYVNARYPSEAGAARTTYFRVAGLLSATRSTHILTVSDFSRDCLAGRYPSARDRITTIYEGPGITCSPRPAAEKQDQVLVIGSARPHKATRETLGLLADYFQRGKAASQVRVAGLDRWPSSWGVEPELDVAFLGRIPDKALAEELASARALVFLSEMEGFGLPFVEAWLSGTPVCFRDASALAEIGRGFPGAWDGDSSESFGAALDEVLDLTPQAISTLRDRAGATFDWNNTAQETLAVYRQILGGQDRDNTRS